MLRKSLLRGYTNLSSPISRYGFSSSDQNRKFNVLFFGTDIIAKTVLEALHKNQLNQFKTPVVNKLETVTSADISGKKNQHPVKIFSYEKNIPCHQPLSKSKETHPEEWKNFTDTISNLPEKFDIGIVCSFGYMIPSEMIDAFPLGMVVIHPSLLPRYRGASPIQYALLNGDQETGVSIIEISKNKFDAGKILLQDKLHINPTARYEELQMDLAVLGGNRIVDFLENFDYYKSKAIDQDKSEYQASKAPKFKLEDTVIQWGSMTNVEVYNRYRAFYGSHFTTVKTKFQDEWLFIDEMGIVKPEDEVSVPLSTYTNAEPGSVWVVKNKKYKNFLYVKCKEGWVEIRGVYRQSKKPQASYKFINQYINKDQIFENQKSQGQYFFV